MYKTNCERMEVQIEKLSYQNEEDGSREVKFKKELERLFESTTDLELKYAQKQNEVRSLSEEFKKQKEEFEAKKDELTTLNKDLQNSNGKLIGDLSKKTDALAKAKLKLKEMEALLQSEMKRVGDPHRLWDQE